MLKRATDIPEIEDLGFADYNFQSFRDVIQKPYGMFLITGPTGSGKSFTTFSILKRVATPEVNVSTVEDPVEYEIPGINQTQVNMKAGLDFSRALRAFLRQDPDIIMVGEIRDHETAKISMEAALTGHLLIATLHTNDAAGAVIRLTEMGIEPFNVASAVNVITAQRLVRTICNGCKVETTYMPEFLEAAGLDPDKAASVTFYEGEGCDACNGSGFSGRQGLYEVMPMDRTLRKMVLQGASSDDLKDQAVSDGMLTLRQDGLLKVRRGKTTLEEVLKETAA